MFNFNQLPLVHPHSFLMPHSATASTTDSDSVSLGSNPNVAAWQRILFVIMLLIQYNIWMRTKYTPKRLFEAAAASKSFADVARYFGLVPHGGSQGHLKKLMIKSGVSFDHFLGQGWSKGGCTNRRRSSEEILVKLPSGSNREHAYLLRRALIESGVQEKCSCGLEGIWNGKELRLEVDHLDGNYLNNLRDNLRFICPNCHSQTSTYRSKNRKLRRDNPIGDGIILEK